jgi:acyl-CoA synthetase (AMP-forming)/AMP-acid ligase II
MAESPAGAWLNARCARLAGRTLLIGHEESTLTFDALGAATARCRTALRERAGSAPRTVAFEAAATAGGLALFFALAAEGHCLVPLNPHDDAEHRQRVREGRAEALARWGEQGLVWEPVEAPEQPHALVQGLREAGRPGLVLFSSGSTGRPKAMLHDFARLIEPYADKPLKDLRLLLFMALDHIGGLDTLLRAFTNGSTLVAAPGRTPEAIAATIARHRVNVLPASPTFLNLLLLSGAARAYDLSTLSIIAYGAEPMPPSLLERLAGAFPGVALQQKFGTSETNAIRVLSRDSRSLDIRIDDAATEYRIEDGELLLKTPARILGYLNAPDEALTEAGWFRTGDLVEDLGGGWLRIIGRKREVINVGGEKVLPGQVEACLLEHPGVSDCVVFGQPHAMMGQVVAAEVVPEKNAEPAALKKALRAHVRSRLEPYKVPVSLTFVEGIAASERFKKQRLRD